jgi:hypothetical protein
MSENQLFMRHLLWTTDYRLRKVVIPVDQGFMEFRPPAGIRSPSEILQHMCDVLTVYLGGTGYQTQTHVTGQPGQFLDLLGTATSAIPSQSITREHAMVLLQGPLADLLTHVGQLALLRRLYGQPVPRENFMKAGIGHDK